MYADFLRNERVVVIDGRRWICRPPTVSTVARLLLLYGPEVWATSRAYYVDGTIGKDVDARSILDAFIGDARAARVLDTCVSLHGGAPGEAAELIAASVALQAELSAAVLSLCNPRRIAASLHLDVAATKDPLAREPEPQDGDEPSSLEASILMLAERYRCSPLDVAEWPYEAYLSAESGTTWIAEQQRRAMQEAREEVESGSGERRAQSGHSVSLGASDDDLAAAGYHVGRLKRAVVEAAEARKAAD